ncbi:hypothetical protein [Clostridium sp.]|uniref:hypothetical protein n=1 Tax=Clostridium sp. TaxID=1506 RepID=UPI003994B4AD
MDKIEELNELRSELEEILGVTAEITKEIRGLTFWKINLEAALAYSEEGIEKCIERIEKIENEINK